MFDDYYDPDDYDYDYDYYFEYDERRDGPLYDDEDGEVISEREYFRRLENADE